MLVLSDPTGGPFSSDTGAPPSPLNVNICYLGLTPEIDRLSVLEPHRFLRGFPVFLVNVALEVSHDLVWV